jgi:hypothetical protein
VLAKKELHSAPGKDRWFTVSGSFANCKAPLFLSYEKYIAYQSDLSLPVKAHEKKIVQKAILQKKVCFCNDL